MKMKKLNEYALYYGDEFKMLGTVKEIAEYMGVTIKTVRGMQAPSKQKKSKRIIVKIEEEE